MGKRKKSSGKNPTRDSGSYAGKPHGGILLDSCKNIRFNRSKTWKILKVECRKKMFITWKNAGMNPEETPGGFQKLEKNTEWILWLVRNPGILELLWTKLSEINHHHLKWYNTTNNKNKTEMFHSPNLCYPLEKNVHPGGHLVKYISKYIWSIQTKVAGGMETASVKSNSYFVCSEVPNLVTVIGILRNYIFISCLL